MVITKRGLVLGATAVVLTTVAITGVGIHSQGQAFFRESPKELVDEVWTVTAPEELRIGRVRQRSGLTEEEIKKRMAAQLSEEEKQRRAAHIIWNDGNVSVIHRVLSLLKSLE